MADQSLPDGVERYEPAAKADPQERGFIGIPSPDGEFVLVSDLPKIEAAAVERERERTYVLFEECLRDWVNRELKDSDELNQEYNLSEYGKGSRCELIEIAKRLDMFEADVWGNDA